MESDMDTHDDLPFLLHDVARLMRTRFDQHSNRKWGMTRAQSVILLKLSRQPGLCQNELAALLEVEPITVARLIDRLEAGGFVERRPDPSDRRMHRLHLLPASGPILAEIDKFRTGSFVQFKAGISEADWEAALRVLHHIKEKLVNDVVAPAAAEAGE
jgi:MarR family transcriptional regulator, transcriptional regulator for hemolysin